LDKKGLYSIGGKLMNFEKIKEYKDIQKELKRLSEAYNNMLIRKNNIF